MYNYYISTIKESDSLYYKQIFAEDLNQQEHRTIMYYNFNEHNLLRGWTNKKKRLVKLNV